MEAPQTPPLLSSLAGEGREVAEEVDTDLVQTEPNNAALHLQGLQGGKRSNCPMECSMLNVRGMLVKLPVRLRPEADALRVVQWPSGLAAVSGQGFRVGVDPGGGTKGLGPEEHPPPSLLSRLLGRQYPHRLSPPIQSATIDTCVDVAACILVDERRRMLSQAQIASGF